MSLRNEIISEKYIHRYIFNGIIYWGKIFTFQ